MSDHLYPSFPGIKPVVRVMPEWDNAVIPALGGQETIIGHRQYPRYLYTLSYEVLRSTEALPERRQLLAFFNYHRGRGESFLFTDPEDHAVTNERFGTTDGATSLWQLTRTLSFGAGSVQEPVWAPIAITSLKRGSTPLVAGTDYTLGSAGRITLTSAGSAGQDLTWSGTYAMRVRFQKDSLDFEKFLRGLWSIGSVQLYSKVYE
jgi:uncharacterized protein (TIGR02217 family)